MDKDVRVTRVDMVRERIYKNHLQTRFFNLQEQVKLKHAIDQLEKLEKDRWMELNHRVIELETKIKAIDSGKKGRPGNTGKKRKKKRAMIVRRDARKASISFLVKPYQADELEYQHKLGYAQHMTKKHTRKSSVGGNVDIELDDLDAYQYKKYRQRTRSQQLIFQALQRTAKDLGMYKGKKIITSPSGKKSGDNSRRESLMSDTLSNPMYHPPRSALKSGASRASSGKAASYSQSRRVSFLISQDPFNEDEDLSKFETTEQESGTLPDIGSGFLAVQTPGMKISQSPSSREQGSSRIQSRGSASSSKSKRRMSRYSEDMRKFLPIAGESVRQLGLQLELSNKLANFNKKITDFKEKSDRRKKRRGSVLDESAMNLVTPANPDLAITSPVVVLDEGRQTPGITLYGMKKWRKVKAVADTVTAIRNCKYLRYPGGNRDDVSNSIPYLPPVDQRPSMEVTRKSSDPRRRVSGNTEQTLSPFQSHSILPQILVRHPRKQPNSSTPKSTTTLSLPPRISIDRIPPIVNVIEGTPEPHKSEQDKLTFPSVVNEAMKNKARLTNKTNIVHIQAV